MSYYGAGEWVVIKSAIDGKVRPFYLSKWYDRDDFNTLKEERDDSVKFFGDKKQTVKFIFDNFDESLISEGLIWEKHGIPSGYYFE